MNKVVKDPEDAWFTSLRRYAMLTLTKRIRRPISPKLARCFKTKREKGKRNEETNNNKVQEQEGNRCEIMRNTLRSDKDEAS